MEESTRAKRGADDAPADVILLCDGPGRPSPTNTNVERIPPTMGDPLSVASTGVTASVPVAGPSDLHLDGPRELRPMEYSRITMKARSCAVSSCRGPYEPTLQFFHTPAREPLHTQWLTACKRLEPEFMRTESSTICERHFAPEDLERDLRSELLDGIMKKKLKPGAVPSRNLPSIHLAKGKRRHLHNRDLIRQTIAEDPLLIERRPVVVLQRLSDSELRESPCCVPGCKEPFPEDTEFHYLPKDEVLREKWKEALGCRRIGKIQPRVCSQHFPRDAFHHSTSERWSMRRKLKCDAVPTLKLPGPAWQDPKQDKEPASLQNPRIARVFAPLKCPIPGHIEPVPIANLVTGLPPLPIQCTGSTFQSLPLNISLPQHPDPVINLNPQPQQQPVFQQHLLQVPTCGKVTTTIIVPQEPDKKSQHEASKAELKRIIKGLKERNRFLSNRVKILSTSNSYMKRRQEELKVKSDKKMWLRKALQSRVNWTDGMVETVVNGTARPTRWTEDDIMLGRTLATLSRKTYKFMLSKNILPLPNLSALIRDETLEKKRHHKRQTMDKLEEEKMAQKQMPEIEDQDKEIHTLRVVHTNLPGEFEGMDVSNEEETINEHATAV